MIILQHIDDLFTLCSLGLGYIRALWEGMLLCRSQNIIVSKLVPAALYLLECGRIHVWMSPLVSGNFSLTIEQTEMIDKPEFSHRLYHALSFHSHTHLDSIFKVYLNSFILHTKYVCAYARYKSNPHLKSHKCWHSDLLNGLLLNFADILKWAA